MENEKEKKEKVESRRERYNDIGEEREGRETRWNLYMYSRLADAPCEREGGLRSPEKGLSVIFLEGV